MMCDMINLSTLVFEETYVSRGQAHLVTKLCGGCTKTCRPRILGDNGASGTGSATVPRHLAS
jgi:hypothetical protein